MKEFKSIAQVIKNIRPLTSVNKDQPVAEPLQQSLIHYWQTQIGIAAPYTQPLLFQSGRLVVFCNSAVWATQMRHQAPSLLRQLNENNFKVSGVTIQIRPLAMAQPAVAHATIKSNPISKASANTLRHLATKIGHNGLRESILRLAKNR